MNIKTRIKDKLEESKNFLQMSYEQAKKMSDDWDSVLSTLKTKMDKYPRLPNGKTPDDVRNLPDWKALKQQMDQATHNARVFNMGFTKTFKKEILKDVEDRKKAGTYGRKG